MIYLAQSPDVNQLQAQENRDIVKKVKEESQKYDALKYEFFVNLELFNRLRKENIVEGEKAVKVLFCSFVIGIHACFYPHCNGLNVYHS